MPAPLMPAESLMNANAANIGDMLQWTDTEHLLEVADSLGKSKPITRPLPAHERLIELLAAQTLLREVMRRIEVDFLESDRTG